MGGRTDGQRQRDISNGGICCYKYCDTYSRWHYIRFIGFCFFFVLLPLPLLLLLSFILMQTQIHEQIHIHVQELLHWNFHNNKSLKRRKSIRQKKKKERKERVEYFHTYFLQYSSATFDLAPVYLYLCLHFFPFIPTFFQQFILFFVIYNVDVVGSWNVCWPIGGRASKWGQG